jgi:hypothetical protein
MGTVILSNRSAILAAGLRELSPHPLYRMANDVAAVNGDGEHDAWTAMANRRIVES